MTDFIAQNTLDKFLDFSPRLDFVLLFLGGNDLDTKYYTDQQNRTTFYGFMNAARVLHQHNIRPYIVSIQERRRPKHTTYRIYEDRRQSLNYQLGTTLTWTLGYNPVIAVPDHNNEFTSDGIHLATVDYYNLTQRIEQVIDYDTRPTTYRQTPLTKNLVWLSKFKHETNNDRHWDMDELKYITLGRWTNPPLPIPLAHSKKTSPAAAPTKQNAKPFHPCNPSSTPNPTPTTLPIHPSPLTLYPTSTSSTPPTILPTHPSPLILYPIQALPSKDTISPFMLLMDYNNNAQLMDSNNTDETPILTPEDRTERTIKTIPTTRDAWTQMTPRFTSSCKTQTDRTSYAKLLTQQTQTNVSAVTIKEKLSKIESGATNNN